MTILLTINMFCFIVTVLPYMGLVTMDCKSMANADHEDNAFYMYRSHGPP